MVFLIRIPVNELKLNTPLQEEDLPADLGVNTADAGAFFRVLRAIPEWL